MKYLGGIVNDKDLVNKEYVDGQHVELTQAEYDALTEEEKLNGTIYFVYDEYEDDYFIVNDSVPIGAIQSFGGEVAPENWLICDGSAVSRTEYSDLFKVIGTTYGGGDGSTTFNIPDLAGRVPIGESIDFDLGNIGGEQEHQLTIREMPGHNHSLVYRDTQTTQSTTRDTLTTVSWSNKWREITTTVLPMGSNYPHNNMQPYLVTNFIIKAKEPQVSNIIKSIDAEAMLLDIFYPVGSYYDTSDENFNPNTVWGGSWTLEEGNLTEERKLLWTDTSSTNFGPQTISIDLTNYDMVQIFFYIHNDIRNTVNVVGNRDVTNSASGGLAEQNWFGIRTFTFNNSGVIFDNGQSHTGANTYAADSAALRPFKIYGINQLTQHKWHRTA